MPMAKADHGRSASKAKQNKKGGDMSTVFSVQDGRRLLLDGKPVAFHASPNFNAGYRIKPTGILLHDTAGHRHGNDALAHFMKPSAQASAHLIVTDEEVPRVIQMVDLDRRAWHAGRSEWHGKADCNSRFIGIELCNPGRLWGTAEGAYPEGFSARFTAAEHGIEQIDSDLHGRPGAWWKPYSKAQIALLHAIVAGLAREFPDIDEVIGHCQVSPGRKVDPTPILYRDHMYSLAQGLSLARKQAARQPASQGHGLSEQTARDVQQRLNVLGYGPLLEDGQIASKSGGAIWAFQTENNLASTGRPDKQTVERLLSDGALPAPIAGRQAVKKKDLTGADPEAAAGNKQAWLGQIQLVLAGASALMALLADLGKQITHLAAAYGGELVILIAVTVLAGVGLSNWTAGRAALSRAYRNWIGGTSHVTTPPARQSAQEG